MTSIVARFQAHTARVARHRALALLAASLPLLALGGGEVGAAGAPDRAAAAALVAGYGKLPLIFEPNRGQTDAQVKFLSRGPGYRLWLTAAEAVLSLRGAEGKGHALRVKLLGAEPDPKVTGLDRLPGVSNYFIGRDRTKWRTGVPHYAKVGYEGVYPGIDLVFYGTAQRQLEYDFLVAPGADPGAIGLGFEGAERLEIDDDGDLIAHLADGEVRFLKPVIYQQEDGTRQPVEGGYLLEDGQVTFDLAAYDTAKPLVIDPVLAYSTYLGGTDTEEGIRSIAVDGAGNAYLAGRTRSADFPIVGGFQDTCVISELSGCNDTYVAKLNAAGSDLLYSTFLGGVSYGTVAVAVDGSIYVVGSAGSDFPTMPGAFQADAVAASDAFFLKLDTTGGLAYSTYLGGSGTETAWDIAVDSLGRAVIGGETGSGDFPTTPGALDTICGDIIDDIDCNFSNRDAFLAVIDPAGNGTADLVYSTFVGGDESDRVFGVAVDGAGLAYLTGLTDSSDFPTTSGAFQEAPLSPARSALLAIIDPTKVGPEGLIYSTYLGGDDGETIGYDVDVKPGCTSPCRAYLTGQTNAESFPTTPDSVVPFPVANFSTRTFVTIIDPDPAAVTGALAYSSFFGGRGGRGIAVGPDGKVFVTGSVSGSIPTRDAIQDEKNPEFGDAFVAVIDPSGLGLDGGLLFATYLGGTGGDDSGAIAVDDSGSAYLTGRTSSQDFPTTPDAYQPELSIAEAPKKKGRPTQPVVNPDAFIVKIDGPFLGQDPVDPLSEKLVASADFYSTPEDGTLNVAAPGVLLNDTVFDSATLTATFANDSPPANGTVAMNPDGSFSYTPDVDFFGTDSFGYVASDGQASDKTVVWIDVAPVNDAPVARNDAYAMTAGETLTVIAPGVLGNDLDVEGDTLTASLGSGPADGTLFLKPDGSFTFTPNPGSAGTDEFTYQAEDGNGGTSNPATVTITLHDGKVHVGDLRPAGGGENKRTWDASVDVYFHDASEDPVVDVASVEGTWSGAPGTPVASRCDWEFCIVAFKGIPKKFKSVTFRVDDVIHGTRTYVRVDNHDVDGDSDGTTVTVLTPSAL